MPSTLLLAAMVAVADPPESQPDETDSWSSGAILAAQHEERTLERLRLYRMQADYERRRERAHARMRDAPVISAAPRDRQPEEPTFCPVPIDEARPILERLMRERNTWPPSALPATAPSGSSASRPSMRGDWRGLGPPTTDTAPDPTPTPDHLYESTGIGTAGASMPMTPMVPLLPPASALHEGVVQIVNHAAVSGEVLVHAIDDGGKRYGPAVLHLGAGAMVQFTSGDLESGNGPLIGTTGPGEGDWRLEFSSALPIEALAYVRTPDGLLAALHDTIPVGPDGHRRAVFHATSEHDNASLLRLINPWAAPVEVVVRGTNHGGATGEVRVSLSAGASRTLSAVELQYGGDGLDGSLGAGTDMWRLTVTADRPIVAMNLLEGPEGRRANLSTSSPRSGSSHVVSLFPSASETSGQLGVLRIVNHSDRSGAVRIAAADDTAWQYETLNLDIDAGAAVDLDSNDLELGNATKGLASGTGAGQGDWRLALDSDLDIEVQAYVRSADGSLSALHDTVPRIDGQHRVAFFAAGDVGDPTSLLRLVNTSEKEVAVAITGVDEAGRLVGNVWFTVSAGAVRALRAEELESGADGLTGALGDGDAWRLVVRADGPIQVMNLMIGPDGRRANLSTAPAAIFGASDDNGDGTEDGDEGNDDQSAEEVFRTLISEPIVQEKCVTCHVEGGYAPNEGARLVFIREDADEDHEAKNLQAFKDFLADVEDGANYILDKIADRNDHGGDEQATPGSVNYKNMERFLELLGGEIRDATIEGLFDGVTMSSAETVLRRAALVFAGRNPTPAEYASLADDTDDAQLRSAIRGLMTCSEDEPRHGCAFHEYLIRSANDRLFTDRDRNLVESDNFIGHLEKGYALREQAAAEGDERETEWNRWNAGVQYAAGRAPLELIAYVVENERPYTEILTAEYVMANPMAAEAYGDDEVLFDAYNDVHEFQESQFASYYLDCGDTEVVEGEFGRYVESPGSCPVDDYPHAGILNSKAFLQRYPTTPTNRNRARSRWTYYHFLGFDVENSTTRTTDADALKDTNNPTRNNPNCTRCHENLDPVAGTFQNYGNEGLYRDQEGGWDALDGDYKEVPWPSAQVDIEASSYAEREEVTTEIQLWEGGTLFVEFTNDYWDEETGDRNVRVDRFEVLRVREVGEPESIYDVEAETLTPNEARHGCRFTASHLVFRWGGCRVEFPFEIPADGTYLVKAVAWQDQSGDENARLGYGTVLYRDGDTWYRDMRDPGFNGERMPDSYMDNGLQWLAQKIVADDRFAVAAVRFWWPSIMGSEIADPAGERDLRHEAQSRELSRLAKGFREGFGNAEPYDLKDLLVEIVMSDWFRAESRTADAPHAAILRHAGGKRLLTPEELARKTEALTGFQWGRHNRRWADDPRERVGSALTSGGDYRLLYGGIDSDGITQRAREITSTMAGVAKRHAMVTSCPIVLREFYLLPKANKEQLLFRGIDETVSPALEAIEDAPVDWEERRNLVLQSHLTSGAKTLTLRFANDFSNEETGEDRDLHLDRIILRRVEDQEEIWSFEFEHMEDRGCGYPGYNPETQLTDHWTLDRDDCRAQVSFEVDADGEYEVDISVWGDQAGQNAPVLQSRVYADDKVPDGVGAQRIKNKLVDLYKTLLGTEPVNPTSPDVVNTYNLFVEVWQRKRDLDVNRLTDWQAPICDTRSDFYYFDSLIDDAIVEYRNEDGPYLGWNWPLINRFVGDAPDDQGVTRTWVVVLAHLLMDYRYLYL